MAPFGNPDRRSCDVRAVHDLHRAAPGAPHRAADGTALHPERIAYRGSGHLPAALMAGGEVVLIVALVGLQSRIVTQSTYAIVVFMTGVTTLLAPPLLRYLFRDEIPQDEENAEVASVQL